MGREKSGMEMLYLEARLEVYKGLAEAMFDNRAEDYVFVDKNGKRWLHEEVEVRHKISGGRSKLEQ